MISEWQMTLQGAYATPELVGRASILKQIMDCIQDPDCSQPRIIYLCGPGGIGKTRLLTEIIARCKDNSNVKAGGSPVDAYHLLYHTPYELTQAIYESLRPLPELFRLYERDSKALERFKLSGEAMKIEEQQEKALRSFVDDLQNYSQKQRVLILLDTIERFVYAAGHLEGVPDAAEAWQWLVGELAGMEQVIMVAAGRPQADELFRELPAAIELVKIPVAEFDEAESQQYFSAAAEMARLNRAPEVAVRLESLSDQEKKQAYTLSGGRPIRLALLADYLSSGGVLAPLFAEVSSEPGESVQLRFQNKILERLLNIPGLGQVLRCMALTTKGIDLEILRKALDMNPTEARQYLQQLEKLSFVKLRRLNEQKEDKLTYFLHDEMYSLLQEQAFSGLHGQHERQVIYERVIECYEERFVGVRRTLAELYGAIQVGGRGEIDYEALNDEIARRTDILLALLYYRLHVDPLKGYRRWFRYDHEATIANELILSRQLQIEFLAFLREAQNSPGNELPEDYIDLVNWSLRLSPVKYAWAKGDNRKVLAEAQRLEASFAKDLQHPIKKAMLLVWKAYALIASDTQSALIELRQLIGDLERMADQDIPLHWLAQTMLAFACRVHAYADRVQGAIGEAVNSYRRAAIILREVDLKIEMATVDNDLGFALALKGEWTDARSLVENALEMRRDLGLGIQVAYSLNTLANIDTFEARYSEAIDNATKALNLFRAMMHMRGAGMALTALAEATRRQSGILTGAATRSRVNMLNNAKEMAEEALEHAENQGEISRQVEALIEIGCAQRDAVRLISEEALPIFNKDKWIKESQNALEEGARLAGGAGILYRQVDALVNLAWLGHYAGGEEGKTIQAQALGQVEPLLEKYELPIGKSKPTIFNESKYQPLLSSQLGKLHVLKGHEIYKLKQDEKVWKARISEKLPATERQKDLYRQLAREYFLGLENSSLYGLEYRDLRLVKQQIFDRLKVMRPRNLDLFVEYLAEVEAEYDLAAKPGSQLRQMMVNRALIAG